MRFSVGAANIRKGNSVYFDSDERRIGPEHIMASAALPPGFPPIEIDGEHYWDGGVVSNTPLEYLLDEHRDESMLVFQVDLFSAQGSLPRNLLDVYERHKDILYSSRTRNNTNAARDAQKLRQAVDRLYQKLPSKFKDDPDVALHQGYLRELRPDQHRAIDLPRQILRDAGQGLRVLARLDAGALADGAQRYAAHAATTRTSG